MKRPARWATAAIVALGSLLPWVGCSSSDTPPAPLDASGGDAAALDPCDTFTTSGAPCSVVSSRVCFPLCATGGCRCVEAPDGDGGVWSCVNDTSCFPDGAPDLEEPFTPRDAADDPGDADAADDSGDAEASGG